MFYKLTPVKITASELAANTGAKYFTVKSTSCFYNVAPLKTAKIYRAKTISYHVGNSEESSQSQFVK